MDSDTLLRYQVNLIRLMIDNSWPESSYGFRYPSQSVMISSTCWIIDLFILESVGKTNRRFQRLVRDKPVWRRLLNGIDDFTEEKLEELVKVGGTKSSERMGEVVKEVANRFVFLTEEDFYISSCTWPRGYGRRSLFKVEVSVKGWDDDIFDMAGIYQLEEINRVAKAVGAQIAIKKVKTYRTRPHVIGDF